MSICVLSGSLQSLDLILSRIQFSLYRAFTAHKHHPNKDHHTILSFFLSFNLHLSSISYSYINNINISITFIHQQHQFINTAGSTAPVVTTVALLMMVLGLVLRLARAIGVVNSSVCLSRKRESAQKASTYTYIPTYLREYYL